MAMMSEAKQWMIFAVIILITLAIYLGILLYMYYNDVGIFAPYVPTPPSDAPYFWLRSPDNIQPRSQEQIDNAQNILNNLGITVSANPQE